MIRSALEMKVDSLTQANEGLMVQNESLEWDVSDHDKLLEESRAEAEVVRHDRDWLLQVGVVRIMDKLIEHPEFTSVVSRIRDVAFVTSEESGRGGLKAELDTSVMILTLVIPCPATLPISMMHYLLLL